MAGAYWVAHVTVTNPEEYARYAELAGPAIAAFGGKFLARGGEVMIKEGQGHARNVVIWFPSLADANACYDSPAYQEAMAFAKDSSIRELVLIKGVE